MLKPGCRYAPPGANLLAHLRRARKNVRTPQRRLKTGAYNRQTYSYLKHSIGSRSAAFLAGHTPKTRPTDVETSIPLSTAHRGMEAGSSGKNNMMTELTTTARNTPSTPPSDVRIIASSRNC